MTSNNYVYEKGTIFVARGGGSAPEPLPAGQLDQVLIYDPTSELGVRWGAGGSGDVTGPGSSVTGHLAIFASADGDLLDDAGIVAADVVTNAGASTDNALARFDSTSGKVIQNSPVTMADTTGTMTFPAGGGTVLTTGGGAARKGTFTLTAGLSGDINTSSVLSGSVIAVSVLTVAGVAVPQAMRFIISNGTKFIIQSADTSDTSSGTWAIVA